jgi:peptidoglycan/LPS O-acetylase OafA/YrhL
MVWQQLKQMQKHNYMIDMMRFFAALIVVLFHLNQAIPHVDNRYRNLVKYGWLGVPMFFVISGYCIILSAYNSGNVKDFLSRRFFRIFPPYWVSIVIVVFAACFQKLYIGSNAVHYIPRNITGILATLTLTTTPFTNINTMNWVYWTLTCELFFYLSVCLILLFNKNFMVYFLIAISLLAAVLPPQKTGLLFFLDQWPAFGLGICIYYFFKGSNAVSRFYFATLLLINLFNLFHRFYFSDYTIAALLTFSLIFVSHYIKSSANMFSKLGQHSYSVYLIHVPVGVYIIGLFESKYIQQNAIVNFIYDLTVYAFISLLAWLIYNRVEKPSIAYGREISTMYFNGKPQKHTA